MNYNEIKSHLLCPQLEERKVASLLGQIKSLYTVRREGLESIEWSREEVSAYASFYLPTNAAKFEFLMNQIDPDLKELFSRCEIVDFGTGPGTYLLSFLHLFGAEESGHLWGVDKDPVMLEQAKKLCSGLFPQWQNKVHFLNTEKERLSIPRSSRDRLVIFGNSCNEMSYPQIKEILETLAPDHVVFIEPGIPAVFDVMMDLRSYFKGAGFDCAFPCPSLELSCPAQRKVEQGLEDWCHQVWRGTFEPVIEKLGQLASIDRKSMPFIGHIYSKKASLKKDAHRFVRYLGESKHAFTWEVCLKGEESLDLTPFEIPKKSLSKKDMKILKRLSVGTQFEYDVIKELKESLRVSVRFL